MEIRKITSEEKKLYNRLSDYAFGEWKDKEIEDEKLKWMNVEHCLVLEEDGKMVSGLINHRLKQSVRGVVKAMSGIGNVATYPEYRNKGYVKALFKQTFQDCLENDLPVSSLQPFKETFYRKFGYVATNREIMFKFGGAAIAHYLNFTTDDNWQVERSNSAQAQQEFVDFISKEALKYNGMVIYDELYPGWREHLFQDDLILLVKYKGEVKAGCRYVKKDQNIRMNDVRWTDITSRKLFFQYFARHRDQIGSFTMPISMGVNFYNWFQDNNKEYEIKMSEGAWMVRVVDVISAFKDIRISGKDKLTYEVTDEMCEWNNGIFQLAAVNGKAVMEKVDANVTADFKADIRGMSALLYGAMPVEEIIDRGWLEVFDVEKQGILESWFPVEIFFNSFWF
ncbi:MAG: GNAT family N-acetyltransferase [Candidatus Cloacimonetes bacterium]|nr:GNAT family N-acetyltransferase [Candidatus Cloacimonadota bacterium]